MKTFITHKCKMDLSQSNVAYQLHKVRYYFYCELFKQIHKKPSGKPLESSHKGTEISPVYLRL